MDIQIGKFHLRSDMYCLWIDEEYTSKGKDGKPGKKQTRRVAGYAPNIDILVRQFVAHRHMASEAQTVEELIKELKQTAEDAAELKKTAIKSDLKAMRQTAKAVKAINAEKGE